LADLIIPATLRIWLVFLFVFVLLRYPVPFSIVFGGIGGLAGGVASAWWQIKGGKPIVEKERRPTDRAESAAGAPAEGGGSRWEVPFFKPNQAKQRNSLRARRTRNPLENSDSRWELPFLKPDKARQRYTSRIRRTRSKRAR
jgi:hypothetical protein